jgi:hypothetical protein
VQERVAERGVEGIRQAHGGEQRLEEGEGRRALDQQREVDRSHVDVEALDVRRERGVEEAHDPAEAHAEVEGLGVAAGKDTGGGIARDALELGQAIEVAALHDWTVAS